MDSFERQKHFLQTVKAGDRVALWIGHHTKIPRVVEVEKVTKTQIVVKDYYRRFSRKNGREVGKHERWSSVPQLAELTGEDLRAMRRARDVMTLTHMPLDTLSDDILRQLATIVREATKEQGSA